MSTASTDLIYRAVLNRLTTYVDANAQTLGIPVYRIAAPEAAAFPFGILSLKAPQSEPGASNMKLVYQLELMLLGRPRKAQAQIEALGDRAAQALLSWCDGSNGLVYAAHAVPQSLPAFSTPADADVVQVRVTAELHVWPTFLTSLST